MAKDRNSSLIKSFTMWENNIVGENKSEMKKEEGEIKSPTASEMNSKVLFPELEPYFLARCVLGRLVDLASCRIRSTEVHTNLCR